MSKITKGQIGEVILKDERGEFGGESSEDIQWLMANGGANWRKYVRDFRVGSLVAVVEEATTKFSKPAPVATTVKGSSLLTTYDPSMGLRKLMEWAVGPNNLGNINSDIIQKRFKLREDGIQMLKLEVKSFLDRETNRQAAARLMAAGHVLANTGDLAGFLHDHSDEVEKWSWVFAISEDSRWTGSGGYVCAPFVSVVGEGRCFDLNDFRDLRSSCGGVLVFSKKQP